MYDVGLKLVVIVIIVMAMVIKILNPEDIVSAMMGMTIQLCLGFMVAVLVESGLMAVVARLNMMPLRRSRRHLYNSWVMISLKLCVGNGMHESLLFHFSRSLAIPHLPLREPSWVRRGHPLVGVPLMTSDEVETLATGLIPGSRASFFDFDAADELGPAHSMTGNFSEESVHLGDADE